jgi:general secretion pathway protein D
MKRDVYIAVLFLLVLAGCAAQGPTLSETSVLSSNKAAKQEEVKSATTIPETEAANKGPVFSATPSPNYATPDFVPSAADPMQGRSSDGKVSVNFYDLPIAQFINEVFGNLLGFTFEIASGLSAREDLVTLKSSEQQSHGELYRMSKQVLLNYGVGIEAQDTHLRFFPAQDQETTEPPLFVTGMALPGVPVSHRTVFRFVPLTVVKEGAIRRWVLSAYEDTGLVVTSDPLTNSILLQGPGRVVAQAAKTIGVLDQPTMRGRHSMRITPSFVNATTLAKMLTQVLETEGFGAVLKPPFGSVIVLPMQPTNSVIVFAADAQILEHVKNWARELDRPVSQNASNDYFYYQVNNTSAGELAEALAGVGSGGDDASEADGKSSVPGIFVDKNRNGLIFTGDPKIWKSFLPIIRAMDRPARLVSIEVTVASVTLSDDTDIGVQWLFKNSGGDFSGIGRTDFGLGASGFSYALNNAGQVRFALNALSQDQRVSILSKPSVMVKSGGTASIDVGQEVPIITSQAQSTDTGDAPVLQGITYRKTGVLLEVEPTVHSGNRVDLNIGQEVSEVLDSVATSLDSPVIFNRKLATSLTLRDGGAVILGGLISSSNNVGSSKVPILGDIPGVGALFRSSGKQETRSELVLIIQAYIIDVEEETPNFNDLLKSQLQLLEPQYLELD